MRGLERIRNSDLRTLKGRDRFSSPRSSESWDCHRVTRIRRAPRKRQSLQTGRGGANPRFASAVRCFLSGIESPGAAVPGTKGHRKVDLVERNASVPLKATETTLRNFGPSLHRKLYHNVGLGSGRGVCKLQSGCPPGTPESKENPPPRTGSGIP